MTRFQTGERVAPHGWGSMPPVAGGFVVGSLEYPNGVYAQVKWDDGVTTAVKEDLLRPAVEAVEADSEVRRVAPGVDLKKFDHGVDCNILEWGWDGLEGESGLPCTCWRAVFGLPEKVER